MQGDQLLCSALNETCIVPDPSVLKFDILVVRPTELSQCFPQRTGLSLSCRISLPEDQQHPNTPLASRLLRPRRERQCGRRATEQRDEGAATDHSITSSAVASSVGGTVRPNMRAVCALM